MWFVSREAKPKGLLHNLRNCFVHGHYEKRQKNKQACIVISHKHNNKIKVWGFLPIDKLKDLVNAAESCICD